MCLRVWLCTSVCLLWFIGRALGDCVLPQHPAHGHHQAYEGECEGVNRNAACDGTPGMLAPEDWLLVVHCNPGYQPVDPESASIPSVCSNGMWSKPELPHCIKQNRLTKAEQGCIVPTPPPSIQYRPLAAECGVDNISSGSPVPQGCIIYFYCAPGFQLEVGKEEYVTHCNNGSWSHSVPTDLCISQLTKTEQVCIVPTPPPSIQYRPLAAECGVDNISPGSPVPQGCIIYFYCAPGFQLEVGKEEYVSHCNNERWSHSVATDLCIRADVPDSVPPSTKAPSTKIPSTKAPSTEAPSTKAPSTSFETVQPSTGCMLPETSTTRRFCSLTYECAENCHFYDEKCLVPPGSRVRNVKIICAPGYATQNPTSNNIATCLPVIDKWFPPIPECIKLCRPLKSEMLLMTCRYGTKIVECSEWALPGTTVSLECAPTFSEFLDLKLHGIYRRILTCTTFGEWSHDLPICKPACGVFNKDLKEFTPTIVNGEKAMIGFFPWHAGLYYRTEDNGKIFWDQQCGGSLISDRFILTAAHCVYPVVDDVSLLRVALGKYYRSWDHDEPTQEKRNVTAIRMSSQYIPSTFSFDLALVLLKERIKYGAFIMPVCRDFDAKTNIFQNTDLYVVGWGKTGPSADAQSSDILLFNSVRTMSDNECRRSVPGFYSTFEKICAVKKQSVSITQKGDSGGGLTAVYRDGLHYIVGVVSTKVDNVSIFTNIKWSHHIEWIENEMIQLENNRRQ